MMHFTFISRPTASRPCDRFPSDTWLYGDAKFSALAALMGLGFSFSFTLAWNFHFPTYAEKVLWRTCSVYHTGFTIYGSIYYLIEMFRSRRQQKRPKLKPPPARTSKQEQDVEAQTKRSVYRHLKNGLFRQGKLVMSWIRTWRNISHDQDPNMEVPLRIILPVTVICFLYILCRIFIYFEDFFALREQPAGVYVTVNKFMPFLVGR